MGQIKSCIQCMKFQDDKCTSENPEDQQDFLECGTIAAISCDRFVYKAWKLHFQNKQVSEEGQENN